MTTFNPHTYLNSFTNFETHLQHLDLQQLNLDRVHELLDRLDNPQVGLRVVHVAGTKGKGSTCMMMASILQHAGLKVGLYTSPHLYQVNERIRVLDQTTLQSTEDFYGCITDERMAFLLEQMRSVIDGVVRDFGFLTYFEVLTVLAIVYFAHCNVDVVILETGLGGRLDATNAMDSHVAVITPISRDHMHILGTTLAAIAGEKAGIIKDKYQTVIVAPQDPIVDATIEERCHEWGIVPTKVVSNKSLHGKLALIGEHQVLNASVALAVVECLRKEGVNIADQAIDDGLRNARWPGRFETVQHAPLIVVDSAHNEASVHVLSQTVKAMYPNRRVIMVIGVSADKDVAAIVRVLKNVGEQFIFTQANHPRAYQFSTDAVACLLEDKPYVISLDVRTAMETAKAQAKHDDIILITGSIFIVAEARKYVNTLIEESSGRKILD